MTVMCRLVGVRTRYRHFNGLSTHAFRRSKVETAVSSTTSSSGCGMKTEASKVSSARMVADHDFRPYFEMLNLRRKEAERSILVEVDGIKDTGGIKNVCEKFGPINNIFYYKAVGKNFVLVEFRQELGKIQAIKEACHSKNPQHIPVTSPSFYFYQTPAKASSITLSDNTPNIRCNEKEIIQNLQGLECNNQNIRLKSEMEYLHQKSQISDLSIRLRFFTCHQLDAALGGICSEVKALPFGSSVSGFGRNAGDLDIFLHFKKRLSFLTVPSKYELIFHSKSWVRDKNLQLKFVADLISIFLPGCSNVMSILSARVPIIKYRQTQTNLECDLQNSAASGIDLSHIMYIMNHWDPRVAPLVYTVRMWASRNMIITSKKPSPGVTNFALIYMVFFYLQTKQVLPSLQSFQSLPDNCVSRSLDRDSVVVFPDLRRVQWGSLSGDNSEDIDSLLFGFFDFYSKFEFSKDQISLDRGIVTPKESKSPLVVENPVKVQLNISKNVTQSGLMQFIRAVKEARNLLDEGFSKKSITAILACEQSGTGLSLHEARWNM